MAMRHKKHPIALASASLYAALYPGMVKTARRMGYALAIHGSLARDMDIVAIPWTEKAVAAKDLAEAIRKRIKGFVAVWTPAKKPHGRLAWSIHLRGGPYIDLSVMPRRKRR